MTREMLKHLDAVAADPPAVTDAMRERHRAMAPVVPINPFPLQDALRFRGWPVPRPRVRGGVRGGDEEKGGRDRNIQPAPDTRLAAQKGQKYARAADCFGAQASIF
jgi:hypothetical protein